MNPDDDYLREALYYWPAPYDNVLRNKGQTFTQEGLEIFKSLEMNERWRELENSPWLLQDSFGQEHFKDIHRFLFQDVYEWAGDFNLLQDPDSMFAPEVVIDQEFEEVQHLAQTAPWDGLKTPEHFGHYIAKVYGHIMLARPFLDGNEQASLEFIRQIGHKHGFTFRPELVDMRGLQLNTTMALEHGTLNPEFLERCFSPAVQVSPPPPYLDINTFKELLAANHDPTTALQKWLETPQGKQIVKELNPSPPPPKQEPPRTRQDLAKWVANLLQEKLQRRDDSPGDAPKRTPKNPQL